MFGMEDFMKKYMSLAVVLLSVTNAQASVDQFNSTEGNNTIDVMEIKDGKKITCEVEKNIRFCKDDKGLPYTGVAYVEYENNNKQLKINKK